MQQPCVERERRQRIEHEERLVHPRVPERKQRGRADGRDELQHAQRGHEGERQRRGDEDAAELGAQQAKQPVLEQVGAPEQDEEHKNKANAQRKLHAEQRVHNSRVLAARERQGKETCEDRAKASI